jgi:chemosensory pili system protein ChpA (sensor histidine kinase/response regulator)
MKDPNDIDFTTLNWVKQELDETIKQARQALEAYLEDQGDKTQLKYSATYLHQVQGTLRMVELYGAAMVVEEMEKVTLAMVDGDIKQSDETLEVLMRGLVQMPDYLGRLQGGHRDIPIVLLPLLNDLRASRSEKLLSETALFSPNLSTQLPGSAAGAATALPDVAMRGNASKLRLAYQFGLLKWIKGDDVDGNLGRLIAILDRLRAMSVQADARRLWWIASGVLEGVLLKALEPSVAVKLLYGKVDREIKRLVDSGESAFERTAPVDLTKSLLYYAAHSQNKGARIAEIKQLYKLDTLLPSESELEHAKSALSGRNKALLDTVGSAIKEDVMRVKDGLDMFLRGPQANVGDLAPQGETLQRVADTLGVLGLGIPRKVVMEQRDIVTNIVTGKQLPEEQTLLDVAGALLFVESSLDDYIDRLGQGQQTQAESAATLKGLELPQAEVRRILDATMKEATVNLSQAKQDIVAFIESPWDHGKIEGIPKLLEEISGALRMLSMPEPAELNDGVSRFIEVELLKHKRVPTSEQLDLMADALASIEYYLEAIREARPNRDRILEVTRRSLESLGYWPLPDPNALGTSASLDNAPSSNEFVSFPDDFQSSRLELAAMEPKAPDAQYSLAQDNAPVLSLSDIPLTEAAAVAITPESTDLDLTGFVIAENEPAAIDVISMVAEPETVATQVVQNDEGSAFSDFDLSMLDDDVALASAPIAGLDVVFETVEPTYSTQHANTETSEFFDLDSLIGEDAPPAVEPHFDFTDVAPEAPVGVSEIDFTHLESVPAASTEVGVSEASVSFDGDADSAFDLDSLDILAFEAPVDVPVVAAPVVAAPVVTPSEPIVIVAPPAAVAPVVMVPKKVDIGFPASGFQMVPSDDIDDEIREVFVEEVQDELEGLAKSFPAWRADQNDFEKLKPVRRSFHTLKGSGRLVGALAIGEFSWKVENMLNRVLDKSIPVSPAVIACLEESIGALPQLLAGLRGEGTPTANIGGMMYVADRVSAGEEIFLPKNEPVSSAELPEIPEAAQVEAGAVNAHTDAVVEPNVIAPQMPEVDADVFSAHAQDFTGALLAAEVPIDEEIPAVVGAAPEYSEMPKFEADQRPAPSAFDDAAHTVKSEDGPGLPEALANDPMLVEILKSEAGTHVSVMRAYVSRVDRNGAHEPVSEELLRAVHTLNGAIAMVDLPFVSNVVGPLEGLLKRVKNKGTHLDERALEVLSATADLVDRTIDGIDRGDVRGIESEALEHYVIGMRDNLPEPETMMLHSMLGEGFDDADELNDATQTRSQDIDANADVFVSEALAPQVVPASEADTDAAFEDMLATEDAGKDQIDFYEVADLADLEAFAPDEAAPDAALSQRSDQLLADLARLEEQAFAPMGNAAHGAADDDVELLDLAFLDAEPEPVLPTDADNLHADNLHADDLHSDDLHSDNLRADNFYVTEVSAEADVLDELSAFADNSEAEDAIGSELETLALLDDNGASEGLVDLSFLDQADDGLLSAEQTPIALAHHDQELLDLDTLAVEDDLENPFGSITESDDSDTAFADLGLFDELEIKVDEFVGEVPEEVLALDDSDFPALPNDSALLPTLEAQSGFLVDADLDALLFDTSDVDSEKLLETADIAALDTRTIDIDNELEYGALDVIQEPVFEVSHLALTTQPDAFVELQEVKHLAAYEPELLASPEQELLVAQTVVAQPIVEHDQPTSVSSEVVANESAEVASDSLAQVAPQAQVLPIAHDSDPSGPLLLLDPDEELLEIFVQEGTDILDTSDNMMAKLRETPEDHEIVIGLQRELHTLKGGARMAGINPVGDLSHAMESLFEAIVDRRAKNSPVAMEALERSFDRLHQMVTRVGKRLAIGQPENVIARLDALVDGREDEFIVSEVSSAAIEVAQPPVLASAAAQTTAAPDAVVTTTAKVEPKAEPKAPAPAPAPRAERKTALDEDEGGQRQQQESIRVRADLIDNLVNFAGEVSIYRSRLEAQIGGFRFNLQEFDQTVLRLRDQLRKLEMETEAQILSRYQREEVKKDAGFDPLELDRFSTLQQLSRALAESVSDLVSLQNLMDDIARQSETLLLQQSRVSSELQEGLMRTRMVPFDSLVPRLRRIIRQTGGELGKRANLKVEGSQGEMDRTVMERMTAPLEHMLRNALAHGLETPQARRDLGKAEEGNVTIAVSREATEVVIKVSDDGKGLDRDAIRRKAIERGLLRADAQLSDRDLFQFILETGFSTAETVSKVAGRGVGMDVVNSEIKQLGGSLLIDSVKGVGSVFTVRLPFTLSVTQAILIKLADTVYAVPLSSVQGVIRMPRKELDRRIASNDMEVSYAGETYQIYDLGELIRQPVAYAKDEAQVPLVMTRSGDQRAAVRVSQVVGSKEVVVKAVGAQLSSVPGFFGATIMGDGSVIVILDLAPLVRHGAALRQAPELAAELDLDVVVTSPVEVRRQKLVMVVDDSITMRKVTTRVLERNDMEVVTAKDGLDAVEQLQDRVPDLMLLDIEMPRMDGYELATYVKNDSRLRHIPIIMITSRTGDKHRQRAMEIGVERYLGKPYQEVDLLKNVMESLNGVSAK